LTGENLAEESKNNKISFELRNPIFLVFLLIALAILVIELSVSLNRPIAFGDGAYHAYISKYIGDNLIFPKVLPGFNSYYIYSPLLHLLLSTFYMTPFGEILAKAFIPVTVFIMGIAIFVTVSKVFSRRAAIIASILTITVPVIVTYSVLIYTDILMTLFFALSVMFTLIADRENKKKYWILAVIFAGFSFLSKGIGIVSFGFIAIVLIYKLLKKEFQLKEFLKLGAVVAFVAFIVVAGWFIRNFIFYHTIDCNLPIMKGGCTKEPVNEISDKFAGYVTPGGSNYGILEFGLKNFLLFMYGDTNSGSFLIWTIPLVMIIGIIYILAKREKKDYLNLVLIILVVLPFLVIYLNSRTVVRTEDAARYLILSTFVLSLIAGVFIDSFLGSFKKYGKYIIPFIIVILVAVALFNFKDKLGVMSSVTQFSPDFFNACDFIKSNTDSNAKFLSLWGAPTVYNCERISEWDSNQLPDIVLSQNITSVMNGLKIQNISYIFIQKFSMSSTPYQASIPTAFVQFLEDNPKYFENVFENGPKLQECIAAGGCDGTIVYKVQYNQ
jgi:4-amino-4-deoxy-L-arabinose transferase-like glycosyltransferase